MENSIRLSRRNSLIIRTVMVLALFVTVLGTAYSLQNKPTFAATPPDSCFDFDAVSGTIYDYYDNEDDDPANPACARDVSIPSTIGGVEVTAIGGFAFECDSYSGGGVTVTVARGMGEEGEEESCNALTSVTIPSTVTYIGMYAFADNQLASVVIPDSVEIIDYNSFTGNQLTSLTLGSLVTEIRKEAFSYNQLTSVHLPASITSVDPTALIGQGTTESDFDPSKIYYTGLYTSDVNLQSAASIKIDCPNGEYDEVTNDCLEPGDAINYGGHLINPSSLTLNFKNAKGTELKPSQTQTGKLPDNTILTDYLATNGPVIPAPADTNNPTPAEQTAIDQALLAYYRIGDEVTITPPAIPDYVTPAAKAFTLTGESNQANFVYKKPLTKVDFSKPSGSTSNPTEGSVPASLAPAIANSTFAVDDSKECSTIDNARLLPASEFTAPGANYTTLGGLDFTISCTELGKDASVSLTLDSQVADPTQVKVYKKTSGGITDITSQTVVSNQTGKTTISYNLVDGGVLDDDGTVNGTITDPIYVAVPNQGNSQLLGLGGEGSLADTGDAYQLLASLAIAASVIGAIALYLSRKSAARS